MKAVILASGVGSRLHDLGLTMPKCLIDINGRTILERMLLSLIDKNIDEVIITTGYHSQLVKNYIANHALLKKMPIRFMYNPEFAETNYIYSLWLARKLFVDNDILLFHGDLVFDEILVEILLQQSQSAVLVSKSHVLPSKDFKARVRNGRVTEIGVDVFGGDLFPSLPMYMLLQEDMNRWMEKIDEYVGKGRRVCYAEDAFNEIAQSLFLHPVYFDKQFCMEVDTKEDLAFVLRTIHT